jgi:hypothetical protein
MTDPLDRLTYRGRTPGTGHTWSDPLAPELGAFAVALPLAGVNAAIAELRAWNTRLATPPAEPSAPRRRGPTTADPTRGPLP